MASEVPELIPHGEWSRRKQMSSQRRLCYQWQCLREQGRKMMTCLWERSQQLGDTSVFLSLRTLTIPSPHERREQYVPFYFVYTESEFQVQGANGVSSCSTNLWRTLKINWEGILLRFVLITWDQKDLGLLLLQREEISPNLLFLTFQYTKFQTCK